MDYMGRHEVFERYLVEFTQGWVVKGTFEPRKRYDGHKVIDMSKIRMDFARNEISDMSFICVDPVFFTDSYKTAQSIDPKEEKKDPPKSP